MNIHTEVENNEINDSNFQEEGDYIIKKMPKYKYEIKIIHDNPKIEKKERTPDKISSPVRFTIKSDSKTSRINIEKKNISNNNENYNEDLQRSKSPRIETNKFNQKETNIHKENNNKSKYNNYEKYIKNDNYEINNYDKFKNNNDNKYNNNYDNYDKCNNNNYDNFDKNNKYENNYGRYKYDNNYDKNENDYNNNYNKNDNNYNKYDNYDNNYENNLNYQNYHTYNNYKNQNFNVRKNHYNDNSDCDYLIDIFPKRQYICNNEIDTTLNKYKTQKLLNYNYCNCRCRCGCIFKKRRNMNIYNENLEKSYNNYYNFFSPPRIRYFKSPYQDEKTKKNLFYNEYNQSPNNYQDPKNDYYTDYKNNFKNKYDTYFNYNTDINNEINNSKKIISNDYNNFDPLFKQDNENEIYLSPRGSRDKFNNNQYREISDFKKRKKYDLKKFNVNSNSNNKIKEKIKINNNINDNINNSVSNKINSNNYLNSTEVIRNKALNKNNSSFIINKRYNYKKINGRNLTNNLDSTFNSFGRKNGNIMINKSSEKIQTIKVVPPGEKISPLLVKKSVQKPVKEKILNKDGSTTNVMKQTTVITSIESRPIKDNNNNNPKNGTLVKEYVTKIYTTLTKDGIEDNNDDTNNINDINDINNNINEKNQEINKLLTQMNNNDSNEINNNNFKNSNSKIIKKTNNILNMNKEKNNIYINNQNEENNYNNYEINNDENDKLIHNNKISSINNNRLYSNITNPNDQNNNNRINELINYIKYLYYKNESQTFADVTKEETLSNFFLNLNDEDKDVVLNILNDNNIENKNIYNKLICILEENDLINNNNNYQNEFISNEDNTKEFQNTQFK